jgi:nucleoside-diphosphate-sugar epimerase
MHREPVLVTGASGFIGRHVLRKLAQLPEIQLICAIREGNRHPQAGSLLQDGAVVIPGNFWEGTFIQQAFEQYRFEHVVHLAAIRGGGNASPAEFQKVNVQGTELLLREAYRHQVRRFIFCSSVGVYGTIPAILPAGSETPVHGDSQYHRSKIAGEAAVQTYVRKGLNAYIVRPLITYGPGDDGFPQTLVRLVKQRLLWLPRSDHRIHLVDVERLAEVFLSLMLGDRSQRVFIAGDIEPVRLREVANWIHLHFYQRPYPLFLSLPDWTFAAALRVLRRTRNEKWVARLELLSSDWHYECGDTYRLLQVHPVPTREAFGRFLRQSFPLSERPRP